MFDTDKSGTITVEELKFVLSGNNEIADNEQWRLLMKEADTDGDGALDFAEFVNCVTHLVE